LSEWPDSFKGRATVRRNLLFPSPGFSFRTNKGWLKVGFQMFEGPPLFFPEALSTFAFVFRPR
jgi:hypothetical protein